ncbi:unnamed protein product [Ectocarpus sp. 13 AM-2016]
MFAHNFAQGADGGAIRSQYGSISFDGNTTFENNTVQYNGGAIYSVRDDITFNGNTTFLNNTGWDTEGRGGAIRTASSTVSIDGYTTLVNNSISGWGGAICHTSGDFVINGNTKFTNNAAELDGGAILSELGNFTIDGDTTFTNNIALSDGGAIFLEDGSLTVDGETTFSNNTALSDGGAIYFNEADLAVDGNTAFTNNFAASDGGAIYGFDEGIFHIHGNMIFINNTAGDDGGATYIGSSNLSTNGTVLWRGNVAGDSGGAIYIFASKAVMTGVHASFTNNSATGDGGAITLVGESSFYISGPIQFMNNTAQGNGGAIATFDSAIKVEEGIVFDGNKAVTGAGGGAYSAISRASFNGSVFTGNEAIWGGGLALFSSGSPWDEESPDVSGPSNITMCMFERNTAVDGGGMYSAAGYDTVNDTWFNDNLAVGSGGAFQHSGIVVSLVRSEFTGNRAGDGGLAVSSLGIMEFLANTSFESNTRYCSPGEFGYEIGAFEDEVSGTCRFDVVCSSCALSCEEIPDSVDMLNGSSLPVCETPMSGVEASSEGGMVLSKLNLDPGYYRTSIESRNILKCHREEACVGGAEISQYCNTGYQGVYCAVCEEGYASGYQHSCSTCMGDSKRTAMGTSIALFLVAVILIVILIADLIRVVNEGDFDGATSTWDKRFASCRAQIADIIPLASIKILVVAWQIVTQFSSVVNVVYPEVYERFLSTLNLLNLNLGFILSVSCIMDTNFYGRVLFVTIGPLVVLGVLSATYAVARSRNRHSPEGMQAAKHKHLSIALFFLFVIYSSVSFTIFQTFVCETLDNGVTYVRADYSLTCSTGVHTTMTVYASLMIFVYPIGIPAAFAWWLFSNRHDLVKVGDVGSSPEALEHLQPMQNLWAPYKPNRYFFVLVECGRRIALTGLAVFLLPGSAAQIAIEVVFAALFMGVSDTLSPFVDPLDAWLYRCGTWVIFFSMYLALLLKVDASDEDSQSQVVFAKVLIAANVALVVMVVAQAGLSFRRGVDTMRDRKVFPK